MPHLFLARHGKTEWNDHRFFQGLTDLPLNAAGQAQVEALAKRLANASFSQIISSPLQRAYQTAQAIAAAHPNPPQVETDDRLIEIDYGRWDGINRTQIEAALPGELSRWNQDPAFAPTGGESVLQAMERMESLVEELRELPDDASVVLVGHGGILQVLLCLALKMTPHFYPPFRLSNASLSELDLNRLGATIHYLNDQGHLGKL